MPLNTTITRDGKPLEIRWGGFHVASMVVAVSMDSGKGPFDAEDQKLEFGYNDDDPDYPGKTEADYPEVPFPITPRNAWDLVNYPVIAMTPLNDRAYTLTREHKFLDVTDGEILHLLPGDVLEAFRSH